MLKTYHIHFEGIVQGVGFRPFVYRCALKYGLSGWVNNTNDGVHIHVNASKQLIDRFFCELKNNLPPLAVVTRSSVEQTDFTNYRQFEIVESKSKVKPTLLLTPDVALCNDCRTELHQQSNRRYRYPFITCTNCGPRYSIITKLPYDRPNTTMAPFKMCSVCDEEYNNPMERRHFSQTNSCSECPVEMQLYQNGRVIQHFTDLKYLVAQWQAGKIIAIKGIGGYLLTCDAGNTDTINKLRQRKNRPAKPFALMYPDVESIKKDVLLQQVEEQELKSVHAPIVLLTLKNEPQQLAKEAVFAINHGLSRLGIMLPYTPLFELLLHAFKKPVVATSGNITDSTIIFDDEKAVSGLSNIADILLMNNRDIVIPQDDSVIQFSFENQQKIVLRRSRGKAPVYINAGLQLPTEAVLATGSMLKSVFGLINRKNIYISQYLGNSENYDAQLNYEQTFTHFEKLFSPEIHAVVTDKHPDYFATQFGQMMAKKYHAVLYKVQHHKAHFWSVLGENNLLNTNEKVLGVIWDGTGLGDDGNIWGGEFFIYENGFITREHCVGEFNFILADKMVREPRISALSLAGDMEEALPFLKQKFTATEWKIYNKLLENPKALKSSSMGRMFDAVASLLFGYNIQTFEAEASMHLENKASNYYYNHSVSLCNSYLNNKVIPGNLYRFLMKQIVEDLHRGTDKACIAAKFHITLADYIVKTATKLNLKNVAFSGGVFQNTLLLDLIQKQMKKNFNLWFHKEFSPNDEGIPFGQLMYYVQMRKNNKR